MSGQVHIVAVNVGAVDNESVPLLKTPALAEGGGITILSANLTQGGSTDSSVHLVKMGSDGTAVSGTISASAVGGTATPFAANTPKAFTITDGYVAGATYIGIKELNVAALDAQAILNINYVMGK